MATAKERTLRPEIGVHDGGVSERVIDYEQAVQAGSRLLLRTSRIEMDALARELSVSRATLYRVLKGGDRFVADVLWTLCEPGLPRALCRARGRGVDRLAEAAVLHIHEMASTQAFREFLSADPHGAARAVFLPENELAARLARQWQAVLEESDLHPGLPRPADAAALIVAIGSSVLYSALLAGTDPDLEMARLAIQALLGAGTAADSTNSAQR